jgi:hypothetical protein
MAGYQRRKDMTSLRFIRSVAVASLAVALAAGPALGQAAKKQFEPQVGQEGKDVIWVPTAQTLVDKMLDMAQVKPGDFVMDLGSGDGRTVITAAKRGVKAMGIEYNPNMVELSTRNAEKAGVSKLATFKKADLFETDFSEATVITLFLLPDINLQLRPKILDMKPGTRVVSNSFDMGDWEADQTFEVKQECTSYCKAYFWLVPAKAAGTWKMGDSELSLKQTYQKLSGTLKTGNVTAPISNAKMAGDKISFTAAGVEYSGTVSGNSMSGSAKTGTWQASKTGS